MIPYGHQDIDEADIDAVVSVLRSDWLTQGPAVEGFETEMARYCNAPHAIAVCNGTAALHLACRALGLGPGDSLWTSPITFVASANSARFCGAKVDFVDIDPHTYNISVAALSDKLVRAEREHKLPRVVMPVHFAGQPCPMEEIRQLADRYGFAIIEDASHAVGSTYLGERIGSSRYADAVVFSFHPVKTMTTGEGGMVLTNRAEVAETVRLLRAHGISYRMRGTTDAQEGDWYYEQVDLGYNYRMSDIQAALGRRQLQRLDLFVRRRRELAKRYNALLADLPLVRPWQHPSGESAYHLYPIRLQLRRIGKTRREIFDAMRSAQVGVQVHYIPVPMQPYYRKLGFGPGLFPEAEHYYSEALSLPLYYGLSDSEQEQVVDVLRTAITR